MCSPPIILLKYERGKHGSNKSRPWLWKQKESFAYVLYGGLISHLNSILQFCSVSAFKFIVLVSIIQTYIVQSS